MEAKDLGFKPLGRHFVLNIALPPTTSEGVLRPNRDPRKQRVKPDVYVGTVEAIGTGCVLVRPGMRVVVKRWEYRQHDIDDERLVVRETELLILNDATPAPGVCVMRVEDTTPKTALALPQNMRPPKPPYHFGRIEAFNFTDEEMEKMFGDRLEIGDELWVERREADQFFQGPQRLVFRNKPDVWNGSLPILMLKKKTKVLEVI